MAATSYRGFFQMKGFQSEIMSINICVVSIGSEGGNSHAACRSYVEIS